MNKKETRRRNDDAFDELDSEVEKLHDEMRKSPEGDNPLDREDVQKAIADTVVKSLKSKRTGADSTKAKSDSTSSKTVTVETKTNANRSDIEKIDMRINELRMSYRSLKRSGSPAADSVLQKIKELKLKKAKLAKGSE